MNDDLTKIGEWRLIPVYYSKYHKGSVMRSRGPIEEHKDRNNVGLVFMNWETGKCTLPNGEPWIPQKVDYETKFYIVGTIDITEAIEQIEKLENG